MMNNDMEHKRMADERMRKENECDVLTGSYMEWKAQQVMMNK